MYCALAGMIFIHSWVVYMFLFVCIYALASMLFSHSWRNIQTLYQQLAFFFLVASLHLKSVLQSKTQILVKQCVLNSYTDNNIYAFFHMVIRIVFCVHQDTDLSIRGLGHRSGSFGVIIDSQLPYLVGMDDDILSTGVIIFHLKVSI